MATQISKTRYEQAKRIHWKNPHTRRIRQAIGDPKLAAGWDPKVGCWALARLCRRYVVQRYFEKDIAHEETLPVIFFWWRDADSGSPLPITHPMLIPHLRRMDGYSRAGQIEKDLNFDEKHSEWRQQSLKRDLREGAKGLYPHFKQWADKNTGFLGRERGGGHRKHFYEGCLQG